MNRKISFVSRGVLFFLTLFSMTAAAFFPSLTILAHAYVSSRQPREGIALQNNTSTPTDTLAPTDTPILTDTPVVIDTPVPIDTPTPYRRALLTISGYLSDPRRPEPGDKVNVAMVIRNSGNTRAEFIQVDFPSGDFIPLANGGTAFIREIRPGATVTLHQLFSVSETVTAGLKAIAIHFRYSDLLGNAYSDTLSLAIEVGGAAPTSTSGQGGGYGGPVATATMAGAPQLIVGSFSVTKQDKDSGASGQFLDPGAIFNLRLQVNNIGTVKATRVVMVIGGASQSATGLGGAVGNFSAFSPLNSSNVVPIQDIDIGASQSVDQTLIVNNTAQSGSYNLQLSFVYYNSKGEKVIDDQIISLQVLTLPQVQFGLYQPLDKAYVGQPINIPLMLTNLSKSTIQLGQMAVTCQGWDINPPSIYVGKIESGDQWFPAPDLSGTPQQASRATCHIVVNFQDDFGHARQITDDSVVISAQPGTAPEVPFSVTPAATFSPAKDVSSNTSLELFLHALLGFLGLDGGSGQGAPAKGSEQAPIVIPTPGLVPGVQPFKP